MITGAFGTGRNFHQAAIAVLTMPGGDTFRDDRTASIPSKVDHLRTGVGLLVIVGDGHRVKLAYRIITGQNTAWVFPGNSGTSLHLCPRDLAPFALAQSAFSHEVVDTSLSILVTRIPVLDGGIFHFGPFMRYDFDDSRMKLVLIAHRGGTTFKVTDIGFIIRHNQCTFELSGIGRIDTEIGRKLHRTTHAFRDIDKRTVREHRRIQCGKEIITITDHASQILLDQIGMMLDGFAERTEDNALLSKRLLECCLYGDAVHHCIDRHPAKLRTFVQRNTQFVESLHQFRIDLIQALRAFLLLRSGIVDDILIVDRRDIQVRPCRHLQCLPMAEGFQAELKQPFRFILLGGNNTNSLFIQSAMNHLRIYIGNESVLIITGRHLI